MLTVRLSEELEKRLGQVAAAERRTKTDVIREALEEYLKSRRTRETPFALGEDLFGRYGSGQGTLSREYKSLLREKIRAKYAH